MGCNSVEGGGRLWRSSCPFLLPPSSLPREAQWGPALFAHQLSPDRRAQASLGETVKGTEARSALEDQTVESLLPERENAQAHTRRA